MMPFKTSLLERLVVFLHVYIKLRSSCRYSSHLPYQGRRDCDAAQCPSCAQCLHCGTEGRCNKRTCCPSHCLSLPKASVWSDTVPCKVGGPEDAFHTGLQTHHPSIRTAVQGVTLNIPMLGPSAARILRSQSVKFPGDEIFRSIKGGKGFPERVPAHIPQPCRQRRVSLEGTSYGDESGYGLLAYTAAWVLASVGQRRYCFLSRCAACVCKSLQTGEESSAEGLSAQQDRSLATTSAGLRVTYTVMCSPIGVAEVFQ